MVIKDSPMLWTLEAKLQKMKKVVLLCFMCIVGLAMNAQRTSVEVLYGYLKIFPNELGSFQSEPTSVINQINSQAMYGYNNWRIPTNEELALMRANNYIGKGEYMTKESKYGIVLLVSDGKDYATLQAALKAQGLVDLGLPSGTLWKDKNESGFYDYDAAVRYFGNKLPTKEQFEELKNYCTWTWTGSGYEVIGPSGESIVLLATGARSCNGNEAQSDKIGFYWSSTPKDSEIAWFLIISSKSGYYMGKDKRCWGNSVRLIQN